MRQLPGGERSRNARFQETLQTVDRIVYSAIRERRQRRDDGTDLLSLLLSVRDESGEGLDDRQVRDEVVTFVFAGSETSSVMLGWMWYLLALHPEAERRLKAELDAVLEGRTPDFRDLASSDTHAW
jgi:cytochrome P450